jgi:hypothetical protein
MGFVAIACLVIYHYGYIHNLVRDHNKLVLDMRDAKSVIAELQEQIESLRAKATEGHDNPYADHP